MPRDQQSPAQPRAPSLPKERGEGGGFAGLRRSGQAEEYAASDARPKDEAHLYAAAEAPSAPLSARVAIASTESGNMIALRLTAREPLAEITLALADAPPRTLSWHGSAGAPAWIPLPAETIGPGPAAIPIRLGAGERTCEYVLFVPVLARLGESAATAPVARYEGARLHTVLADFTAFTGLVLLVEPPLDAEFSGDVPSGKPGAALAELAARLGLDLHREGDLAYTLTHTR